MDEALRRSYLAAMDIPVWIPRGDKDPFAVALTALVQAAPAPRPPAADPAPRHAGAMAPSITRPGRGQAMLGAQPVSAAASAWRAAAPAEGRVVEAAAFTFGFVRYGNTLLIAECALGQRGEELGRAICFALERSTLRAETQDFSWPPRGAAFVAAEARDAMLARIDKLSGDTLVRLLLLGEAPALLLLEWDAARWASRPVAAQRVEGIACDVFLLPALGEMLANPEAKRVAWEHLRNGGRADA